MRAPHAHTVTLSWPEPHFLLWVSQKEPDRALKDIERILDFAVVMPRHLLGRPDLDLADAESWPVGMKLSSLHLVVMVRIFDWLHRVLLSSVPVVDFVALLVAAPREAALPLSRLAATG